MVSSCFAQKLLRLTCVPIWVVLGICTIAVPTSAEKSLGDRICNLQEIQNPSPSLFPSLFPSPIVTLLPSSHPGSYYPSEYKFDGKSPKSLPKPIIASEFYAQATDLAVDFSIDDRISLLNRAIALDPNYIDAYEKRIKLHQKQKKKYSELEIDLLIGDYERLSQLNPREVDFLEQQAQLYWPKKQWKKIIHNYDKAIKIKPEDEIYYRAVKAHAYTELKDWDNAIAEYSRAIELSKIRPFGQLALPQGIKSPQNGVAMSESDLFWYSSSSLRISVIQTNIQDLYLSRADVYVEQKKKNEAITDYKQVIQLSGDNNWLKSQVYRKQCLVYRTHLTSLSECN